MKKSNLFITTILITCFLFVHPTSSFASTLPDGFLIGDDKGIKVEKDGKYFIEVNDILPGKKWTKKISFANLEENDKYELSMIVSNPKPQGSIDLSKEIQMELIYENELIYKGPISGKNNQANLQEKQLDLGVFTPGKSRTLLVNFSVSSELTNNDFATKNTVDVDWTFYAIKTRKKLPNTGTTPPNKLIKTGIFPNTGEEIKRMLLFFCIGLYLILTAILIFKKQFDQKKTR